MIPSLLKSAPTWVQVVVVLAALIVAVSAFVALIVLVYPKTPVERKNYADDAVALNVNCANWPANRIIRSDV